MTVKFQVKISLQVRMKVMSVHPSKLQDPKQLHLVADLGKPISLEEISDLKARRLGRWFQRLELMERSDKTLNKLMHDILKFRIIELSLFDLELSHLMELHSFRVDDFSKCAESKE